MRQVVFFSIVSIVFTSIAFAQNESIQVDGETRTFIVHAPTGISDPPLVISMHGMGGTGSQQQSMSGFDKIADREKFVVVYPDGLSNQWDISGNKDVNFILLLIDTMAARYQIDRDRVYATGFSMGGMMSYKLACDVADKIAAIGPCSGYLFGGGGTPARPMPILHIHGTTDDVVDFNGLASYINGWVSKNGCPQTAQITKPYPASNPNSKVTKEYYGPCNQGSEIIVLTVEGMGHAYPGSFGSQDIDASEEFWAFFKTHSLSGVDIIQTSSRVPKQRSISVRFAEGKIYLQSGQRLYGVQVFDIQGKLLFTWKAGSDQVSSIVFPANRSAGGIFLFSISGVDGQSALSVVVP